MNVDFKVNENCRLSVDVSDVKQAFQFIAYAESVFKVDRCGNCESGNLRLAHRQPHGFDYYSIECQDCKHEFKFGTVKETGQLFPKGWEPPYEGNGDSGDASASVVQTREPVTAGSTF